MEYVQYTFENGQYKAGDKMLVTEVLDKFQDVELVDWGCFVRPNGKHFFLRKDLIADEKEISQRIIMMRQFFDAQGLI